MYIYFFIIGCLLKNLIYFFILKKNYFPKYIFIIIGFIVLIFSIGITVFTVNYSDKGIIPMILNIDYFLILFSFLFSLVNKLLNIISKSLNYEAPNPFQLLYYSFKLNHFYIIVTLLQLFLMIIYIKAKV
ncbi:hypothetical protein Q763_03975 [Flavobacterium beibuense F44-8]|uniref:Uncharacterized protein n=1 Tax=Flavobacterium beibuense F44-8 TaxID=1406840 RepID=A0A0A2LV56_9FLAO|nr:hypothetical protein Q763_03975 [Flavobacterium beibuense F44-8]